MDDIEIIEPFNKKQRYIYDVNGGGGGDVIRPTYCAAGPSTFANLMIGKTPAATITYKCRQSFSYWLIKQQAKEYALSIGLRSSFGPTSFVGMARIKKIMNDFNICLPKWQSYQVDVFHMMANCLIKQILGRDCDCCLEMAMKEFEWDKIHKEALMLAYRGSGKSMLLTAAAAVFLKNIPGCTICAYAGVQGKTDDFYQQLISFFRDIASKDEEFTNSAKISITNDITTIYISDNDVRWIRPFSTHGMVYILFLCCIVLCLCFVIAKCGI